MGPDNKRSQSSPVLDMPFNGAVRPSVPQSDPRQNAVLDETSLSMPEDIDSVPVPNKPISRRRVAGMALITFGCLAVILLGVRIEIGKSQAQNASLTSPSSRLAQQKLSLDSVNKQLGTATAIASNGVTINGSLVLTPSVQPSNPMSGELYYNQTANELQYYNGTGFVKLQGGGNVTNNVTNVYNTTQTNVNQGAITGSGTAGTIPVFGASGSTLANSELSQSGSQLATTADALQSTNASGFSILTKDASGASGALTLESGTSATAASGDVTIDTGSGYVSGTVVADITFEDNTTDNLIDWYSTTVAPTTAEAHTGSYSLAVTATSVNWGVIQNENKSVIPVTAGHRMFFSLWVRAATTPATINALVGWSGTGNGNFTLTPATDTTTGWVEISGSTAVPAGVTGATIAIYSNDGTNGETHYIDDIEATDLSSSSSSSSLNLGAKNAQFINIGNLNELGATTIYGGSGITLDGGSGALTESGGSISINGSAASTIGTSKGALTLSSGGGTGGGVVVDSRSASTTAFQVQNAAGTAMVLSVDAVNSIVTVASLVTTNDITVDGHIITGGNAPAIVAGTAACTSPTISISGDDTSGTITVTTGTGCSGGGDLANVTFNSAYATVPNVTITPQSAASSALLSYVDGSSLSTNSFAIGVNSTPTASTTYKWSYLVVQ